MSDNIRIQTFPTTLRSESKKGKINVKVTVCLNITPTVSSVKGEGPPKKAGEGARDDTNFHPVVRSMKYPFTTLTFRPTLTGAVV